MVSANLHSHPNPLADQLLQSVMQFSLDMKASSVPVRAFSDSSLAHLTKKDFDSLSKITKSFNQYSDLIDAARKNNVPLRDEVSLLKFVCDRLKLYAPSSSMSKIRNNHIIEIYNLDLVQIYRSLSFMDICSYSLLDLLTFEFYELYERSASVNQSLFEAVQFISEKKPDAEYCMKHVPPHLMREKISNFPGSFLVEFDFMAPVYAWPRQLAGYMVVQKAKKVDSQPQPESIHFL